MCFLLKSCDKVHLLLEQQGALWHRTETHGIMQDIKVSLNRRCYCCNENIQLVFVLPTQIDSFELLYYYDEHLGHLMWYVFLSLLKTHKCDNQTEVNVLISVLEYVVIFQKCRNRKVNPTKCSKRGA